MVSNEPGGESRHARDPTSYFAKEAKSVATFLCPRGSPGIFSPIFVQNCRDEGFAEALLDLVYLSAQSEITL